jgi:phosphohistidine phosphatase SixA
VALFDVRSRARIAAAALGACAAVLVASAAAGTAGRQSPGLVTQLQRGGLVLVLRHVVTDQSKQDEDPVDLADCSTQRNLSADGRAQARTIKSAVRRLKLPIGTVLTSRFCRTRETARLAFGRGKVEATLLNTINVAHDAAWREQMRAARRLIATPPPAGKLTVLVTHGVVVSDATGLTLEEGETLVFRPLGNGRYRLVGRIAPDDWSAFRKPASARVPRVKEYPVPRGSGPHDVTPAPDGTVWYTAQAAGKLGHLDPATGKITEVPLGEGSAPHGVIVRPDGGA